MKFRSLALATLTAALLATAACNGTANITIPNASITANGSVKEAYVTADSSTDVKAKINAEFYSYRAESDSVDSNIWIIFYYAPSTQKSYRCRTEASTKRVTEIVEITGTDMAYKADYKIEKEKVKVGNDDAKATAVTVINNNITNVNITQNVTINNIQNIKLISPRECQEQTGKTVSAPVWLMVVNNVKVYVNAETKETIHTVPAGGDTSASPTPTPMPSATPSVDPGASGAASPSPAAT